MVTRAIDPTKQAGVWAYDDMYPKVKSKVKSKKYTLKELMDITNSPAVQGNAPMVNTNPSLLEAAKGIYNKADFKEFNEHMPWTHVEGEEYSNPEAALIGAGRFLHKMREGGKDLVDRTMYNVSRGDYKKDALQRRLDRRKEQLGYDREYAKLEKSHPMSTTFGEILPSVATLPAGMMANAGRYVAGQSLLKAAALPSMKRAITQEAILGAASGATYYGDSALSGALFGAAGGAGGKWIADFLGGVPLSTKGDVPKIVDYAKKNNLFVPSGMATGNRRLQQLDKSAKTHRATTDIYWDEVNASKIKENNIISKQLGGEQTDYFTDDYLDDQRKRISSRYKELVGNTTGMVDDGLVRKAEGIVNEFTQSNKHKMPPQMLLDTIEDLKYYAGSGVPLTGDQFDVLTKRLNKAASSEYGINGDPQLGKALKQLSEVYGDVIEGGLPDASKASWKEVRRQSSLLTGIETARDKTTTKGASGVEGFVDARKLAKEHVSNPEINMLAKVEKLRDSAPDSSLGTSGMLGRIMHGALNEPSSGIGALALLGGRVSESIGPVNEFLTRAYLRGYPHTSGVIPGFKKIQGSAATIPARLVKPFSAEFNGENMPIIEEEGTQGDWETFEDTPTKGMSMEFTTPDDAEWESF